MKKIPALLCVLLCLCACARTQTVTQEIFAMDTVISVTSYNNEENAADAVRQVSEIIRALEDTLSVTRADSEVAAVNRDGGGTLSAETAALLQRSLALSAETDGAFSPALYTLTSLWGFTTDTQRVPAEEEIAAVLAAMEAGGVTLADNAVTLDGVQLDFGAVAKGYAAAKAAAALKAAGVTAVLSLGGNVQTVGEKPDGTPWQIGIRDPHDPDANIGVLRLGETAVVTSGGYQRYFEEAGTRYCHILDPATGYPASSGLASVTIVAEDGFLADGLSTALYVMGLDAAAEFWRSRDDFEAVLVTDNGRIYVTGGLRDCFACEEFQVIER